MLTISHRTSRFKEGTLFSAEYQLAVEEPLEIFINGIPYAETMRLPGADLDLVTGFCLTQGCILRLEDLIRMEYDPEAPHESRILVELKECCNEDADPASGNGDPLGKYSRRAPESGIAESPELLRAVALEDLLRLKESFETSQSVFPVTGTTHAAAVFDADLKLLAFAEDIGRHNAFDKAIGALLNKDQVPRAFLALLSYRLSVEMVHKAGILGVQILVGMSGPTSSAVGLASKLNMTLIGFLRERSLSIYTHPERIAEAPAPD